MLKELRKQYKEKTGKKAYWKWSEDELKEKLGVPPDGVPIEPKADKHVEIETKNEADVKRDYKTDREVIGDMQKHKEKPEVDEYNFKVKKKICSYLHTVLGDGAYRALLLKMKKDSNGRKECINELSILKDVVREGELKVEIDYFIKLLTKLR